MAQYCGGVKEVKIQYGIRTPFHGLDDIAWRQNLSRIHLWGADGGNVLDAVFGSIETVNWPAVTMVLSNAVDFTESDKKYST